MNESTYSLRIRDNLLFLTRKFNISEAELSRKANLPQATLNRLLKGTTDDPRASTLKAIADFFNITVDQLLSKQLLNESTFDTTRLPIYSMEQNQSLFESSHLNMTKDWNILLTKKEGQFVEVEPSIDAGCLAFEVKGDSMWPQFIEGIFVIIDPKVAPKNRSFVIFLLSNNQFVLRQYIEEEQNRILKPINYAYKPMQIGKKDIFIGTVIQAKSDYRKG